MDWLSFLSGLGSLASALVYLFTGISFGIINCPSVLPYGDENDTAKITCLLMKGSTLFSILYFTIIIIIDMYYGLYDGFILPLSFVILIILGFLLVSLAKHNEDVLNSDHYIVYAVLFVIFQTLLSVKLSHTSYHLVDNKIYKQVPTNVIKEKVLLASLILELLQLLFWTLIPFLWFPSSER